MKSRDRKGAPPVATQSGRAPADSTARRHLLVAAGLCLLTLAVYSNSFSAGFAMDNRGLILQDARVRAATAENIDQIFSHTYWWPYGESGLFRPLTTLSYLFNYTLLGNGEHPAGYHWVNFVLHACNVLLVYLLALRLTAPRSGSAPAGADRIGAADFPPWFLPACIAALWAVHPVLTESVTNIVGRADLLAGMAVLGGLLLYLRSAEAVGWQRWAYLAALSTVTAIGVFSKESAVMVLPLILLYETVWWKERRQPVPLVLGCVAMLIPIQAMLYQRAAVLWNSGPTNFPFYDNPIVGAGLLAGRLTALQVIGKYLELLVWPARLSCDYSWAQIPPTGEGGADWAAWIVLLSFIAAAGFLWRRSRVALFLAGAAVLVFLPTSNLLFPIGTIMAERFLYLPAIAFAAGVVVAVQTLVNRTARPRLAPALLGVIVAACAARTCARNLDWQDDLTLGRAAVAVSPLSFKSHKLLAFALHEADPTANLDRAIEESEKGLVPLNPLPDSRNNADSYFRTAGYYAERAERLRETGSAVVNTASKTAATADYRRALELLLRSRTIAVAQSAGAPDPARFGPLMLRISEAHRRLGDRDAALAAAEEGRRMEPSNPDIHHQIAAILLDEGRADQAAAALMEGVVVTTDIGLRNELLRLYQSGLDTAGCATMPVQGNTALNPSCPIVQRHLCAAAVGTIRLRLETGRQDLAEAMRQTALKDFHCTPESLRQ